MANPLMVSTSTSGTSETPGTPASGDDVYLLSLCAAGDTAALGALFDRHATALRRFLARFSSSLDSSADLDDLVQSTFLEVFRGAAKFRGQSAVRTWLLGIAVNVCRHRQRSDARKRLFLVAWARHEGSERTRSDEVFHSRLLASDIDAAVAGLSPKLRAAFLLCDVEELTGQEAAEVLGLPAGTVGRHLHEARLTLRAALGDKR